MVNRLKLYALTTVLALNGTRRRGLLVVVVIVIVEHRNLRSEQQQPVGLQFGETVLGDAEHRRSEGDRGRGGADRGRPAEHAAVPRQLVRLHVRAADAGGHGLALSRYRRRRRRTARLRRVRRRAGRDRRRPRDQRGPGRGRRAEELADHLDTAAEGQEDRLRVGQLRQLQPADRADQGGADHQGCKTGEPAESRGTRRVHLRRRGSLGHLAALRTAGCRSGRRPSAGHRVHLRQHVLVRGGLEGRSVQHGQGRRDQGLPGHTG